MNVLSGMNGMHFFGHKTVSFIETHEMVVTSWGGLLFFDTEKDILTQNLKNSNNGCEYLGKRMMIEYVFLPRTSKTFLNLFLKYI